MYIESKGVEQDYKQAYSWFLKAAEQGFDKAQQNLGIMYKKGMGIEKNLEKATYWFSKTNPNSS